MSIKNSCLLAQYLILALCLSACTGHITIEKLEKKDFIPHKNISFKGTCGYTILQSTKKVELRAAKISHIGPEKLSGTLRLSLWASGAPSNGESIIGKIVAVEEVGQVNGGIDLSNVKRMANYMPPPKGEYFMILAIEEYSGGGLWNLHDTCHFDKKGLF